MTSQRVLYLCVTGLFCVASASGQLPRTVEVENQHASDAATVVKVALDGTPLQCGIIDSASTSQPIVPFQAGSDWLKHLTISLLNRTDKTIVYAHLQLGFPETGDGKTPQTPMTNVPLTLGITPTAVAFNGAGKPLRQDLNAEPLNWGPGQILTIPIAQVYDDIQGNLTRRVTAPQTISELFIRRSVFIFSDNMKWSSSRFWAPDQQRLGNWVPLDGSFFPGRSVWPPRVSQ